MNAAALQVVGVVCVIAAGVSFGFMPLFKTWVVAGDSNLSTAMLMFLRFGVAAAVLGVVIAVRALVK